MTRLIDVDALIETMRENAEGNEGWYGDTWAFMRDVESAPTIDAVQVVRCKDCKWSIKDDWICGHPNNNAWNISTEHYCGYGERRDDEGR